MVNQKSKNIILIVFIVLVLISGLVYYFNYNLNLAKQDYESKILDLNQQTTASLQTIKLNLQSKINDLHSNLTSQILNSNANLQNFKNQNKLEMLTLSHLIEQIGKQNNLSLNELKVELKDIKIKSADFSAIVEDVLQSVVSVKTNLGQGSGAIIDTKGYVVTNVHVINGASSITVTTYLGKIYNVGVLAGYDEKADIAVLKISAPDLKSLGFGNSDGIKVGEKVIAAGNPAGLAFTVTEGIVSAFRISPSNIKYIQTDVPINPGNSGGPLINIKGEILGINNFKVRDFEGLGFAISSNEVKSVVSRIISDYESNQNK